MSDRKLERLRRDLDEGSRREKRRRYPLKLRERAVDYARDARARGMSDAEIARVLGVNRHTFVKWERQLGEIGGSFRAVELVEEQPPKVHGTRDAIGGVVVTIGSMRIEGLDLEGLAELVRRVG
jgi:transposase-like protein